MSQKPPKKTPACKPIVPGVLRQLLSNFMVVNQRHSLISVVQCRCKALALLTLGRGLWELSLKVQPPVAADGKGMLKELTAILRQAVAACL